MTERDDEIERTLAAYERDPDAFEQRYLAASVAEEHGDPFFDALDGERVLDAGCGPGRDVAAFADAGLVPVGLDLSPSFLRTGRERVPGAAFVRGDMRELPFDTDAFDGIWCCAAFLHVPRAAAPGTLREFRRVLRPGGVCLLTVKRRPLDRDGERGRHFEYYDPDELRALLTGAGFEPVLERADEQWVTALVE